MIHWLIEERQMSNIPDLRNTVFITTLAMLGAIGIVVRTFIQITVIPGLVVLTPGFLFSLLGGIVGGIPGGIIVGVITGMGGALSGTEVPILPIIGNICLGLGSGIVVQYRKERDSWIYGVLVILCGGIIGGFIPSMTIFASLVESIEVIVFYASIDMLQAFLWAAVAITVERYMIRPLLGSYLYVDRTATLPELDAEEGSTND